MRPRRLRDIRRAPAPLLLHGTTPAGDSAWRVQWRGPAVRCRRSIALLVAAIAPACGPAREPDAGETAVESTASSAADTTTSTSTSTTTTTTTTSGATDSSSTSTDADGSTGADACTPFHSTPLDESTITIVLRHQGTAPVYFESAGGCSATEPITITAEADASTIAWLNPASCHPWECDDLVDQRDCSPGCPGCVSPDHGRLDPGAVEEREWNGRSLTALDMTADCAPGIDCERPCWRIDPTTAGAYEIALIVYRTCTGMCGCDGDDDGQCSLFEADTLADPVTFSAPLDYPTQTSVEIVITD
jgi:hypothetical protein